MATVKFMPGVDPAHPGIVQALIEAGVVEVVVNDKPQNICEGCAHCEFPGIRWPASPDGYNDLSYVDRCDYCERYDDDEAAAQHVAAHFGVRWGWADREACYRKGDDTTPPAPEHIRWEPPKDDGLDYTGWSAFVDRPERDG